MPTQKSENALIHFNYEHFALLFYNHLKKNECSVFHEIINNTFSYYRATDQIVLLHRTQVHPRLSPEGSDAFPGKLRER